MQHRPSPFGAYQRKQKWIHELSKHVTMSSPTVRQETLGDCLVVIAPACGNCSATADLDMLQFLLKAWRRKTSASFRDGTYITSAI